MLRTLFLASFALTTLFTGEALAQERERPAERAGSAFERLDSNGDGSLSRTELGERGQRLLERLGKDGFTREDAERFERAARGRRAAAGEPRRGADRGERGERRFESRQAGRSPRARGKLEGRGPGRAGPARAGRGPAGARRGELRRGSEGARAGGRRLDPQQRERLREKLEELRRERGGAPGRRREARREDPAPRRF